MKEKGGNIMGDFDCPEYDDCRKWIQKKRDKKIGWSVISMAEKGDEHELELFLERRQCEDDWPSLDVYSWKKLVEEVEAYESKQQSLIFRGNDGALFDPNQDNGLKIPENERSCWQLYKNSLGWKPEALKNLEEATYGILRRLSYDTKTTGPIKGLVIGHVQSGKTANMEALMAMAADHGWNMFIVLSGMIETLRLQTLKRMQKDLNKEGNLIWRGIEHPSKKSQYGERAQDFHFEAGAQTRYFTVCLKNSGRLKKLIDWIHSDRASHELMRMLIIDDEADQASISNNAQEYRQELKERKGINKLIVNLVSDTHYKEDKTNGSAKSVNYVMYTATPYANFLNEATEDSLYPKDFIWTLKTSDEYIGPNQIFGFNDPEKADGIDIVRAIKDDDLNRIIGLYEGTDNELPETMKDAIAWFLCAVATMRNRNYKKPISMLVHTSQKQVFHDKVANAISDWINVTDKKTILSRCKEVYIRETSRIPKEKWIEQFPSYGVSSDEIDDYLSFDEILPEINELVAEPIRHIKLTDEGDFQYHRSLHLVIDNCSKNGISNEDEYIRLAYPDPDKESYPSPAPAFIIVGGSTLSRGLTIEGLVSTFFLRASCQADTLMQMGRWFGYRRHYELMPRIWMTEDTEEKFRFLSELEVDLREDLKKYMISGVRPIEYGPRILCSPKVSWLKLTSKKHMRNSKPAEMDFSGCRPQTVIFDDDEEIQRNNLSITLKFLEKLGKQDKKSFDNTSLCWRNVTLEQIMEDFLIDKFVFSDRSRVFNEIGAFCEWIKQISEDGLLKNWSVVVAGNGKIVSECEENQDRWNVAGYSLGKVNRSRKPPKGDLDKTIDIGALRALKDLVADIDDEYVDQNIKIKKQEDVDIIRKKAGMDKVPMLVIYRINGQSHKPTGKNDNGRVDMNKPFDIIGVQICIPGDQINRNFCKKLTVQLPEKDIEDEVEERYED